MTQLPALQPLSFASWHAWYRDYSGVDLCQVAPRTIEGDLTKVNDVLVGFLQKTEGTKDTEWAPENLVTLEQGNNALSPAIAAQVSTASRTLACKEFQGVELETVSLFDAARRGQELSRQVRLRLAEAPSVVAYVRAVSEIRQWKEQQRVEQEAERSSWCAPKPDKVPVIYYAAEDETGVTEWFFCEGSRVRASTEQPPAYVPAALPPVPSKRGSPGPKVFIAAIDTFPAEYIRRSPKLPGTGTGAPSAPRVTPATDAGQ